MSTGLQGSSSGRTKSFARRGLTPMDINGVEIAVVLLAVAMLVSAFVFYWTALRPEQARLKAVQVEYEEQRKWILEKSAPAAQQHESPAERARAALASLDTFRDDRLTAFSSGRIALINELNSLIKKNGLQLTSGIELSSDAVAKEDAADEKPGKKNRQKKADDLENIYPGLTVHATVFGQYTNVRAFIADVERSKQFLLINSIGLVNQEARVSGRGSRPAGGAGIALTVDLRAYFRPTGA